MTVGEDSPGLWARPYRALVAGLLLCVVLTAFEILAVATVMPIVVPELGGLELYGWAVAAFFLGSLPGTVVVGGRGGHGQCPSGPVELPPPHGVARRKGQAGM